MNKRIIYQNSTGGISVLIPCKCELTIDEIAKKDVPTGLPYKIINVSQVPVDRETRETWTVDVRDLNDGVGE